MHSYMRNEHEGKKQKNCKSRHARTLAGKREKKQRHKTPILFNDLIKSPLYFLRYCCCDTHGSPAAEEADLFVQGSGVEAHTEGGFA